MRKFFGLASNFWLEGQWHLYGAAFLCAGGYVLLVDEHVRVDVLSQRFGPRLRAWLDLARAAAGRAAGLRRCWSAWAAGWPCARGASGKRRGTRAAPCIGRC